jgi:hypothetical protein
MNNTIDIYNDLQYDELSGENFKDIIGYKSEYQISNLGRVRSLKRHIILKQSTKYTRYCQVTLTKNNKRKRYNVHRLVAIMFIENLDNFPDVNHKDENPYNNCVDNLEWCTITYNNTYGHRIEKMVDKKSIHIAQLDVNGKYIKTWRNMSDVGRKFNVSVSSIIGCCQGKYKTCCGFIWMYEDDYKKDKQINTIELNFRNKSFVQLTLDGKYIHEWYSLNQMHKAIKFNVSRISECCNHKREKSNGYRWIYLSEYLENATNDELEYFYNNRNDKEIHDHLMEIAATRKVI